MGPHCEAVPRVLEFATHMEKAKLLLLFPAAAACLALTACGPVPPANPTYQADIRPLLVARCIRCHDDPRRADAGDASRPVTSFNAPTLDTLPPGSQGVLQVLALDYVRGQVKPPARRMPPSPAEALEDWQIDMMATWGAHPLP